MPKAKPSLQHSACQACKRAEGKSVYGHYEGGAHAICRRLGEPTWEGPGTPALGRTQGKDPTILEKIFDPTILDGQGKGPRTPRTRQQRLRAQGRRDFELNRPPPKHDCMIVRIVYHLMPYCLGGPGIRYHPPALLPTQAWQTTAPSRLVKELCCLPQAWHTMPLTISLNMCLSSSRAPPFFAEAEHDPRRFAVVLPEFRHRPSAGYAFCARHSLRRCTGTARAAGKRFCQEA